MTNPLLSLAALVAALLSMCAGTAALAAAWSLLRSARRSGDAVALAAAFGSGALTCGAWVALRALGLVG